MARLVRTFAAAGVSQVVIVTGVDHQAIVDALDADEPPIVPRCTRNPEPARGQLSSLWTGMDTVVGDDTEGLLMTLVDVPLVDAATVTAVIEAWRGTRAPVVRPASGARHGHPVLFDRRVFPELRRAALDAGAKEVIRRYADVVLDVPVTDEGCLADVDTPHDYEALRQAADRASASGES